VWIRIISWSTLRASLWKREYNREDNDARIALIAERKQRSPIRADTHRIEGPRILESSTLAADSASNTAHFARSRIEALHTMVAVFDHDDFARVLILRRGGDR
jgi:hypothetical protein